MIYCMLIIILGIVFFKLSFPNMPNKYTYFTIICLFIMSVGYMIFHKDINQAVMFIKNNGYYRQEIDRDFKFKNENSLIINFSNNIEYQLVFEIDTDKLTNERDSKIFEKFAEKLNATNVEIYDNDKYIGSFNLYYKLNTSWSKGTIIYQDKTHTPMITGFTSEKFSIPFIFKSRDFDFKFKINDNELISYINQYKIKVFVTQRMF